MLKGPSTTLKSLLCAVALSAAHLTQAGTSVGVSIGIGQPGVYGRIDVGSIAPPALIYPQPMIIAPSPVAVYRRPIYLYVPPGHYQDWQRHCRDFRACDQPVYFVREDWVRQRHDEQVRHAHHGYERHEADADLRRR